MPSRPASLTLDFQDEERDIGDALLSSESIPSSSRTFVGFQSGTPRTTGLTPAHASSPNVSTRRTPSPDNIPTLPQGLKISGPSLPASLSRSSPLPRRVSERSTIDIGEIEHERDPQGFSKLNVLPIGLDSAAVKRVQRWITGIALVDFDIDQGPVLCAVYPSMALTASDISNIAFSSFPDSPQFEEGSQMHSFRLRLAPSTLKPSPRIPSSSTSSLSTPVAIPSSAIIPNYHTASQPLFINGFSYFTQFKDPNNRRGYRQQALVLLTLHSYPALFSFVLSLLGPIYARSGGGGGEESTNIGTLKHAFSSWENWPDHIPGESVVLTFLGTEIKVDIPHGVDEQLFWSNSPAAQGSSRIYIPASAPPVHLPSIAALYGGPLGSQTFRVPHLLNAIPLFAASSLLPNLWAIWENLVLCEPILVCGDSPTLVSSVVWWIVELGRGLPLSHSHDVRPYVTINDTDCSALINAKHPGKAGLVLGVTNPWLEKQCMHWGCAISLRGSAFGCQTPVFGSQGYDTPIVNSPIGTPSSIGSPITFQSGLKSTPASSSKARFMFGIGSGSDPASGGLGTHGWKSRSYKRYISKDRSLLKKLEDAWKGDNEREQVEATLLLRQHFNGRTRELLLPLTRYLNTLIPSPAELAASSRLRGSPHQTPTFTPTFTPSMASLVTPLESQSPASSMSSLGTSISAAMPRLKPFSRTAFFASLKDHGCPLPFRSAKQRIQFYERWLKCRAFGIWLAKQEEIVGSVLQKENEGEYSTAP
ncbi:hypothetical protein EYR40_007507 [Pleurotus pulmonarius]|nr:hypothetical protein EYR36_008350 [Pleurotus pulmonarius]KAF4579887.1 hypothetical protein EYR36_001707 [Pleurotus pulmonarius]KAF4597057.1 hypothetical protein EYR40_007507 [Pleurotus pulmonarius]